MPLNIDRWQAKILLPVTVAQRATNYIGCDNVALHSSLYEGTHEFICKTKATKSIYKVFLTRQNFQYLQTKQIFRGLFGSLVKGKCILHSTKRC